MTRDPFAPNPKFVPPYEPGRSTILVAIIGLGLLAFVVLTAVHDADTAREQKAAAAQAAPKYWPCPLPAKDGDRFIVTVEKRGGLFHVTCRPVLPLIAPIAPKGTPQ